MKPITLILAVTVGVLLTSDLFHAAALRRWNAGDAAGGMRLISTAGRINPFAFNVRLDQIESLYAGYRDTRELAYLSEIVLIARDLAHRYPGNVQAQGVYASALIYRSTHGGAEPSPMPEAMRAIDADPLSVTAIENLMFLLSYNRTDYELFKTLGAKRARIAESPLKMRCALCGRPWLDHKEKSK